MLTYILEKKKGEALYRSLYQKIKEDIVSGRLRSGEKLPSKRAMAEHLGVSCITVENAYEQLIAEGYLRPTQRKGYFVEEILPYPHPAAKPVRHLPEDCKKPSESSDVPVELDLADTSADPARFPFSIWIKLLRRVTLDCQKALLRPVPYNGIPELREVIAEDIRRSRGIEASPEQIVLGAGTESLYNLLLLFFGREKRYAIENPGYPKIRKIYRTAGADIRGIPLDDSGVSLEALNESDADILHISPSHHFPTGIVMPAKRRHELYGWAMEKKERYIIEDDYDSEFGYYAKPIPAIRSIDRSGKILYMNTFTKTLAPSLRISYMVLPEEITESFREKLGFFSCPVPSFEQYTLASFIAEGYFDRHISRMRKYYREVRRLLTDGLGGAVSSGKIQIRGKDSGLHFLMTVDTTLSDAELCRLFRGHGIKIRALSEFMFEKKNDTHTLLVNDSSLSPERAAGAAAKILECLSDC